MPAGCFHLSYYYGNSTTDESTKLAPYFLWTLCLSVANVIAWGEEVQVAVCQVIAVSSTLTKLCVCPPLGKLKTRPEGLETISQPFAMIGTFHTPCNHLWKNFLRSLLDQAALHTFLFLLDLFFTCGSLWNSLCCVSLPVFLPLNRPITDQPTLAAPCCLWSRLLKRATKRKLMSLGDLSYSLPPKFITSLRHSFLLLLTLCVYFSLTFYSSEHGFFLTLVGWGQSTARMASSNTVFRPRWVKAEHSRYFTASASEETQNNTSEKTTYRNEQEVNKLKLHVWALTPPGDYLILIGWRASVN